ncbi:DnaB-like helicase C-terminal domain-containing protein [Actinoplanes sp. G11-F43]|uniref:DnaB-like helicase C-terminal domain-containing protein n=1 Tax=Actinoplanes sp. G11-F43 TaxID=3424130 RepID=UPI003D33DE1F
MSRDYAAKNLADQLGIPYAAALRQIRAGAAPAPSPEADATGLPVRAAAPMTSGLAALDALTGGLRPGQLVTFAGPSMSGLSVALATVADQVAVRQNVSTLWVEMESDTRVVGERLLAGVAQVELDQLRKGSEDVLERLRPALQVMARTPLFIEVDLTSTDAVKRAVQVSPHRPRLLIIDGVRLLDLDRDEDDYGAHLDRLARRLKELAVALDITICVSQPVLSVTDVTTAPDLEGFVTHADQVILLHTTGRDSRHSTWTLAEMELVKNQADPTGRIPVVAHFAVGRFASDPGAAGAARR